MNDQTRAVAAHAIIAAVAVGGLYVMLLQPRTRALARLDAAIAEVEQASRASDTLHEQVPVMVENIEALGVRAERIHDRSRNVFEEGALYVAIFNLAAEHAVRIDRIEPFAVEAARHEPELDDEGAPNVESSQSRRHVVGYRLALAGSFTQAQSFVRALQRDFGYTRIRAINVHAPGEAPTPDVAFHVTVECYGFDASPAPPRPPEGGDL
jgi:hypothetical protein